MHSNDSESAAVVGAPCCTRTMLKWQVMAAEAHLGHTVSPNPVHQLVQTAAASGQCSAKTAVFQPATQQRLSAIMRQVNFMCAYARTRF